MTPEGEVPWFPDESQIPADYPRAFVHKVTADVHWEGAVAKAVGSSVFDGNRGEMKLKMSILQGAGTVAQPHEEFPFAAPIIQQFTPTRRMEFAVGGTCDHVVNFHVFQSAKVVIGIAEYVMDWSIHNGSDGANAIQPACQKEEIPDEGEGGGEEGGGTGGPSGGGTTVTCRTTTYEIQVWNGTEWLHERYEYETHCY